MSQSPLCFVIMPFGRKADTAGGPEIDFDRIYREGLEPAIRDAGMHPVRADEERSGGIIHKSMLERLLLCDYALADLTTADANVFYQLGVRHAARPQTTLTIFATGQSVFLDVEYLRSLPYALGERNAFGEKEARDLREGVARRLRELALSEAPAATSVFNLLSDWAPGDIARLKTDVFRDRVRADEVRKRRLADIRTKHKLSAERPEAAEALRAFRLELAPLSAVEPGTLVDLMLTYRALEDWDSMIQLYDEMPEELKRQVLVREQLGFAFNRRAGANKNPSDRERALQILGEIAEQRGPSSETLSLIGRIRKDQWKEDLEAGDAAAAAGHLGQAIDAYRHGYTADQRDAYPGINLLTLLDIQGESDSLSEKDRLLPVVRFAVEQRLVGATPDYWDYATLLELAVLEEQPKAARERLGETLDQVRELWEPASTAANLKLIEQSRRSRGEETAWLREIIGELEKTASS